MKRIILSFFFIAVSFASVSATDEPFELIAKQIIENIQLKFDLGEFFLAFNRELGLTSTTSLQNCSRSVLPTTTGLEQVLLNIVTLNWNGAFADIPAVRENLDDFQDFCFKPWNAYSNYFGSAASAATSNPLGFLRSVLDNLVQGKFDAILDTTDFIVFLLQGLDSQSGQAFANLVQVALSSYIPPSTGGATRLDWNN